MQEAYETHVRSLSREDPLEEGMATHSSILAWRIPMDRGAGRLQSMRLHRVGHDCSDLAHSTVLFLLYFFFSFASSSPPSSADIQNPWQGIQPSPREGQGVSPTFHLISWGGCPPSKSCRESHVFQRQRARTLGPRSTFQAESRSCANSKWTLTPAEISDPERICK